MIFAFEEFSHEFDENVESIRQATSVLKRKTYKLNLDGKTMVFSVSFEEVNKKKAEQLAKLV